MNSILRINIGIGLLLTGLILSNVFQIIQYDNYIYNLTIFRTNYNILFSNSYYLNFILAVNSSFILLGIILILSFNKTSLILSSLTLLIFGCLYSNPKIDDSLSSLIHFIETFASSIGLMYLISKK